MICARINVLKTVTENLMRKPVSILKNGDGLAICLV